MGLIAAAILTMPLGRYAAAQSGHGRTGAELSPEKRAEELARADAAERLADQVGKWKFDDGRSVSEFLDRKTEYGFEKDLGESVIRTELRAFFRRCKQIDGHRLRFFTGSSADIDVVIDSDEVIKYLRNSADFHQIDEFPPKLFDSLRNSYKGRLVETGSGPLVSASAIVGDVKESRSGRTNRRGGGPPPGMMGGPGGMGGPEGMGGFGGAGFGGSSGRPGGKKGAEKESDEPSLGWEKVLKSGVRKTKEAAQEMARKWLLYDVKKLRVDEEGALGEIVEGNNALIVAFGEKFSEKTVIGEHSPHPDRIYSFGLSIGVTDVAEIINELNDEFPRFVDVKANRGEMIKLNNLNPDGVVSAQGHAAPSDDDMRTLDVAFELKEPDWRLEVRQVELSLAENYDGLVESLQRQLIQTDALCMLLDQINDLKIPGDSVENIKLEIDRYETVGDFLSVNDSAKDDVVTHLTSFRVAERKAGEATVRISLSLGRIWKIVEHTYIGKIEKARKDLSLDGR
jgi:hypothetical protein